jgi:hypothetical protein
MKFKFFSILTLILSLHFNSNAQNDDDVQTILKISLINPGFSGEFKVGKFQTLYSQAFMNTSFSARTITYNNNVVLTETKYYFDPAVTLQYRYYYNYNRRQDKGKKTSLNNMNYFGPDYEMFYSKLPISPDAWGYVAKARPVQRIGAVWGLNRNYNRFFIDLNLGLGYMFAKSEYYCNCNTSTEILKDGVPTFMGQLNLGFLLGKSCVNK